MKQVFRIIDVNLNRVREATRVIEDYARFILEDKEIYDKVRFIRHRLIKALSKYYSNLISLRDVENDPIADEQSIPLKRDKNLSDIIISNLRRLSEALRSIVEYLKIQSPALFRPGGSAYGMTAEIEKLRFDAYQLEQQLFPVMYPRHSLHKVRLYVLVPATINNQSVENFLPPLIKGGADAIQLRAESINDRDLLLLAKRMRKQLSKKGVLLIINNRVDIANLSNADGVHLGESDISIRDARRLLGQDKVIGATSHSIREVLNAQNQGADYISVGPFFPSPTKSYLKPGGFEYLEDVANRIHIPYFAIGGINKDNLSRLIRMHKKLFRYPLKVAVSSAITHSKDIYKATRDLKSRLVAVRRMGGRG
ncbi:MAG: thiamine phosphate synthase [Planctomycetota bacterium]|nr:thiamine phosphate synthase [Planctomycetota bacterium]MDI6787098.1 thiamine phosphate synthase [Planctomycetota bacterium]